MSNGHSTLQKWHRIIASGEDGLLNDILHDVVVFHSPVVFTPQRGKAITYLYLKAASEVLNQGSFVYTKEVVSDQHAVLEFKTNIDGVVINGVDIITFDEAGKITAFKVMVRPLKAVHLIHQKMGEMLNKMK